MGDRSLHHGTMLLDLELGALANYLNPSKAKLEAKGVQNAAAKVMNLKDITKNIDHDSFCDSVEKAFIEEWGNKEEFSIVNMKTLTVKDLEKIPQLMEIYNSSKD